MLLMTLGFWECPPTQSYLENSLLNGLKLTQIGHFSTGGDTLIVAVETDRLICCFKIWSMSKLYVETDLRHKLSFLHSFKHFLDHLNSYSVTISIVGFNICFKIRSLM